MQDVVNIPDAIPQELDEVRRHHCGSHYGFFVVLPALAMRKILGTLAQ
jgi:hypothetical protein